MEATQPSLALWQIQCRARSFVTAFCLTDEDLIELECWAGRKSPAGLSPSAWSRGHLERNSTSKTRISKAATDLLDLRYVDRIMEVRDSSCEEVYALLVSALMNNPDLEFADLLWAMATDPRRCVQTLADVLTQELFVYGCQLIREKAGNQAEQA